MDIESVTKVALQSLENTCQLSNEQHLAVVFAVQLIVQFSLAMFNYFAFTKNPNVESNTLFQAVIELFKRIIFFRRK